MPWLNDIYLHDPGIGRCWAGTPLWWQKLCKHWNASRREGEKLIKLKYFFSLDKSLVGGPQGAYWKGLCVLLWRWMPPKIYEGDQDAVVPAVRAKWPAFLHLQAQTLVKWGGILCGIRGVTTLVRQCNKPFSFSPFFLNCACIFWPSILTRPKFLLRYQSLEKAVASLSIAPSFEWH